jgi:succinate dehydrogenase/fumarate reductase flavoprotein subunit
MEGSLELDISHLSDEKFQRLRPLLPKGAAPGNKRFRVAPTAHFTMGGVMIDVEARTRLDGLYAAGEVCGGVHGANRLTSNALTEIFVFGTVAGRNAALRAAGMEMPSPDERELSDERERLELLGSTQDGEDIGELRRELRSAMWQGAGIIRGAEGLKETLDTVARLRERFKAVSVDSPAELLRAIELFSMLTVGEVISRAALERTESRGAHYRADYPQEGDPEWLKNIVVSRRDGEISISESRVDLVRAKP